MPLQSPPTSLRRVIFIWITAVSPLAFLSHALIISPSSQSQRYQTTYRNNLVHFRDLPPIDAFGLVALKYLCNGKTRDRNMILNLSFDKEGVHNHTGTRSSSTTSKKRSTIRRIQDYRFRKRTENDKRNTTSFALIFIAGIVSIFSTGNVQRIAVSVISYTTAKYTYDLFEKFYTRGDEDERSRGRKRLKDKFQKKYYNHDKERRPHGSASRGISSRGEIGIGMRDGTSKRTSRGETTMYSKQQSSPNSNPNGEAWLKQSMDNLEETDRMIADLKRQEAEARAAEQKAKAREWVNETLRATTNAKARADVMRRQEEEARHKAQKWAESVARQSGVDLN